MKLGIDLGGTKIECVVLAQHEVKWRERVATPSGDYERTLESISGLVKKAKQACGIAEHESIGIGTPGALTRDADGSLVMKNCNSVVLNGKALKTDLEERLGCQVNMANDANCFALAETLAGAGRVRFRERPPELSFGVILGTGVGGGVVVQGTVVNGLHSISGEWGHNSLPAVALHKLPEKERNRRCYCGRQDCIETYLSGPGLSQSYQLRAAESISSEEVIRRMRAGEPDAVDVWQSYLQQLAVSLAQVINILDPQLVILGGGMSNIDEIYPAINQLMLPYIFTERPETPIVRAELGDSAGVFGAAYLGNKGLDQLQDLS